MTDRNDRIEKVFGNELDRWYRSLIRNKGSYYTSIPKHIIHAMGLNRKDKCKVRFSRMRNQKGDIVFVMEPGKDV
jgi:hypothetical protein